MSLYVPAAYCGHTPYEYCTLHCHFKLKAEHAEADMQPSMQLLYPTLLLAGRAAVVGPIAMQVDKHSG